VLEVPAGASRLAAGEEQQQARLAEYPDQRRAHEQTRRYLAELVAQRSNHRRILGTRIVERDARRAIEHRRLDPRAERIPQTLARQPDAVDARPGVAIQMLKSLPRPREMMRPRRARDQRLRPAPVQTTQREQPPPARVV